MILKMDMKSLCDISIKNKVKDKKVHYENNGYKKSVG